MKCSQFQLARLIQNPEIWVSVFAFILRLWFLHAFAASPFFEPIIGGNDRSLYDGLAQRIAHGQFFPNGVFEYMPLYPWILGVIYFIFGPNLYVVGLLGILLDTITTFLIVRLSRWLGAKDIAAVGMGVLYALYPIAIIYSVVTMANTLNTFLLILFFAVLLKNERVLFGAWNENSKSMVRCFMIGIFAGIIALGFAGMLLIFFACLIYFTLDQIRLKQFYFPPFAFCFLGFILPILPVTIHNWRAEHHWVLVTAHGGFNFYIGNHANATGYPVQIGGFRGDAGSLLIDAKAEAERIEKRKLTSAEFSEYWSNRAWSFIRTHPLQELKLAAIKLIKFWNHAEYDDMRLLPMFQLTNLAFTSPLWVGFGWLSWLGLMGFLLASRCSLLKVITLSGIIGVISFFITSRYRLIFVPLLAILGALSLGQVYSIIRETFRKRTVPPNSKPFSLKSRFDFRFILLGLTGLIVWIPIPKTDFRVLDYYNTAAYLTAQKKYEEALRLSKEGMTITDREPELYFVMGNAYFGLGKHHEAISAYKTALQLKPSHASAHYNLAQTWMALNQPAIAAREAALALQYDPSHLRAATLLREARATIR